jgi:glycosyltransferase involved in cell wall biosynthesis
MENKKITVLLCVNGEKGNNKPVLDRQLTALKYALESEGIEYTFNYDKHYDLVHLLNMSQYKAYQGIRKSKRANSSAPVILSLFNDYNDFDSSYINSDNREIDYIKTISKMFLNVENDVKVILCNWESQKILLKHSDINVNSTVINPGIKEYFKKDYTKEEIESFRKYYRVTDEKKIVIGYGEYDYEKGFDELEAIARIMPNYEFFYFGGKTGFLSNSIHYERTNKIKNLHYHPHLHRELYHSAIFCATALFVPYMYHVDSVMIMEMMKGNVPIVSAKNPYLYNLLIDRKTALLGENVEDYYNCLKDIESENVAAKAKEFIDKFTIKQYGENLKELYSNLLRGDI